MSKTIRLNNTNDKVKILFLVNDLSFFNSHRLPIAEASKSKGFDVVIAYGEHGGANPELLERKGFKVLLIPMERGGTNVFSDLRTIYLILTLFKSERPNIVHLVTIKPYLYGGIIARLTGVSSVVSAVSGLGTIFIHNDFKSKFLRFLLYPLYHFAFNHTNQTVIVQNKEDARLLESWGVLNLNKVQLLRGSGVNLDNFVNLEEHDTTPVVCFVARLLVDKGVYEFASAAKILNKRGVRARFFLAGGLDHNNNTGLNSNDLNKIKEEGFVEVLGYQKDIPELYSKSHIVCLPSYREGLPKSLIEAAAASRAVITTDVPGCRDAIEPNISGLLVPVMNDEALADAIHDLIKNPEKRKNMGKAGRLLAEKEFRIEKIVDSHIRIYEDLIDQLNAQ